MDEVNNDNRKEYDEIKKIDEPQSPFSLEEIYAKCELQEEIINTIQPLEKKVLHLQNEMNKLKGTVILMIRYLKLIKVSS